MTVYDEINLWLNKRQCVDRLHRKNTIKPKVYHLDIETVDTMIMGDSHGGEVLAMARKIGDGPVEVLPWEAAIAREDWAEVDRQHAEFFAGLHRQNRLQLYDDLRRRDQSWLTRKLLTLEARARTLFGR